MFINLHENIKNKLKKAFFLSMASLMMLPNFSYADNARYSDPYSRAAIISDNYTGRIIYQKDADRKTQMASLSKIMTLLLTFDAIKEKRVGYNDVVRIIQSDVNRDGTNMKLVNGDSFTLNQLLHGLMIISANDAALAIARHVGGNYKTFVDKMNAKARQIGMSSTTFYNPNGLPVYISDRGKRYSIENTTTARDVMILSKWIYNHYPNELIAITSQKRFVLPQKKINEENTNPLLPLIPEVDGIKTGYTDRAGYCLSYTMKVPRGNGNDIDNRLFGVTMGSGSKENRKKVSYDALKYITANYKTRFVVRAGEEITKTKINGVSGLEVTLVPDRDVYMVKKDSESISKSIRYNVNDMVLGLKEPLGILEVKDNYGNIISRANLYSQEPLKDFSEGKKLLIYFSSLYSTFTLDRNNVQYPTFIAY